MHPRTLRAVSGSVTTAFLLLACGCPCETLCQTQADAYAECLGDWGMTWTDVGYPGIELYTEDCKDEVKLDRGRRTDQEKVEAAGECADMNTILRGTDDCEQLFEDLAALGGSD